MNDWIVLLPIIHLIAVILSIWEIFGTCKGRCSGKNRGSIVVLSLLVMFVIAYPALAFVEPTQTEDHVAKSAAISSPFFHLAHSILRTWLATKLHNVFKNPWAALIAYIFPPVAIIAALFFAKNTEKPKIQITEDTFAIAEGILAERAKKQKEEEELLAQEEERAKQEALRRAEELRITLNTLSDEELKRVRDEAKTKLRRAEKGNKLYARTKQILSERLRRVSK